MMRQTLRDAVPTRKPEASGNRGIAYGFSLDELACGAPAGWIPTMGFSTGGVPWKSLLRALPGLLIPARITSGTIYTRC
jgi:hypothetical protein